MDSKTDPAVVPWLNEFDLAKERSRKEQLPILLCFSREG